MPTITTAQARTPQGATDVELSAQYREIGSAAILAALACKMKQAKADNTTPVRARRAA